MDKSNKIKLLIVGSGAREAALTWKLSQSPLLGELFVSSKNPWIRNLTLELGKRYLPKAELGMAGIQDASRWLADSDLSPPELCLWAVARKIDLVVCGPEGPLAEGLADAFAAAGIPTFGPNKFLAQLESSKAFAKEVMKHAQVPTADYEVVFSREACRSAAELLLRRDGVAVLKASGLAAGKGVVVCRSAQELAAGLDLLYGTMAAAAEEVVVEEFLPGRECSFFVFLGPKQPHILGFAVDYKRAYSGDEGPNTGGMGCYTPVSWLPEDAETIVMDLIVRPLQAHLSQLGQTYCGCLYVGLMWSEKGPRVVEFNVRLGDPEAQILAVADPEDWLARIVATLGISKGSPSGTEAAPLNASVARCHEKTPTVGVVLASQGYPLAPVMANHVAIPKEKFGLQNDGTLVFPAAIRDGDEAWTLGAGRVMTLVAKAASLPEARSLVYQQVEVFRAMWPDLMYRPDIADKIAPKS